MNANHFEVSPGERSKNRMAEKLDELPDSTTSAGGPARSGSGWQRVPHAAEAEAGEMSVVARGELGHTVMPARERQPGIEDVATTNGRLRSRTYSSTRTSSQMATELGESGREAKKARAS